MRTKRAWPTAVVAVVLALVPTAGRAASQSISVTSNSFSPPVLMAEPGDAVTWNWAQGGHDLVALDGSFSVPISPAGSTHTRTFSGGILRYRCTVHSSVAASGQCNGMCGVVTEEDLDTTPPTVEITQPGDGGVTFGAIRGPTGAGPVSNIVTFVGIADDNLAVYGVRLRVFSVTGTSEHTVTCSGCGTTSAEWTTAISLLPGYYSAEALAADTSANPATSARISFVVL